MDFREIGRLFCQTACRDEYELPNYRHLPKSWP